VQPDLNGSLYGNKWASQYQKSKTNLDLLEQETVSGSGISWAIRTTAPHPTQITMRAPHHWLKQKKTSKIQKNRKMIVCMYVSKKQTGI